MADRDVPEELIPTRASLIQRLKNWQDQASWKEFFETYWRLIYGIAIKRGLSTTEAQDVVQETMISVAKHMPAFKYDANIGSFKTWLLNMTRWRITDQLRKRMPLDLKKQADPTTLDQFNNMGSDNTASPDLEKIWNDEWEKNLLEVAVSKAKRRIEPLQYQIFDFYVNKGWAPERVATLMGVSLNQVYTAKSRVTDMISHEVERLRKEMI